MNKESRSWADFQHRVVILVLLRSLTHGQGGPLLLLGVVGVGTLGGIEGPGIAAIWAVAAIGLSALASRGALRDRVTAAEVERRLLAEWFPVKHLSDAGHRKAVQH